MPQEEKNDQIREFVENIVKDYIQERDWEVKENANKLRSHGCFVDYLYRRVLGQESILKSVLPPEAVEAHKRGDMHVHKLPYSIFIPYCIGWSVPKILRYGLRTAGVISVPAKHLDVAISHFINFAYIAAHEWSGANAFSAIDLYCGAFIERDRLTPHQIRQYIQELLYEANYPTRLGYQSIFLNITVMLDTVESVLQEEAIVGGHTEGCLGDYLEGAIKFVRELILEYNRGDGKGQPFTFPIPTVMLTPRFDWEGRRWDDITNLFFENLAKRGSFYLLNGYKTSVEGLYAMCCRLAIDYEKICNYLEGTRNRAYGTWAIPDATGSIGVITLNLPRIAILSKGEDEKFFDLLEKNLEVARKCLLTMRRRYSKILGLNLLPLTKFYLGGYRGHFNTFGIIGLPEAAANFFRNPHLWLDSSKEEIRKAIEWEKEVIAFIDKFAQECESKDGVLYNVEEVPGESACYKLALKDIKMFKDEFDKGEIFIPVNEGEPIYSNSIVPYYTDLSIYERAELEGKVQNLFTAGVMMHLFFGEAPDPEAVKKIVRRIAANTDVVYFSITPAQTVCRICGWKATGIYESCERCGNEDVDIWSRIVGYYRPIRLWNRGRFLEFRSRVHYLSNGKIIRAKDILRRKSV